jgi:putative radical SAM enzyme (TIGR03279 family)
MGIKMNKFGHEVKSVKRDSIAYELEIEPGDVLLRINGKEIKDVFDYQFLINDEYLEVLIKKPSGEEWELEIEKEYNEDLGIDFKEGLMDSYLSCRNKCVFCFIDQMPKGMRDTLYFKDDDSRLSFLQGNYITLTNMKDEDIERIIQYKLSPINISVHTTNKELRVKMLNNRFAGEALDKIQKLYEGQIEMNSQIVLCKGLNDGAELVRSIEDISKFLPYMMSLSIVPVGMTKYREGLENLSKFYEEDAKQVLEIIHKYQNQFLKEHGTRFVHASDEWYITAKLPIPEAEYYEGYGQIENGVGMVRSLTDEFDDYLDELQGDDRESSVSIATGVLAAPLIEGLTTRLNKKYPGVKVNVFPIINEFFGKDITVAGLLTGQDIIKQLKEKDLGKFLILPDVLLRADTDILLDDMTVKDIENALQIEIRIVKSDGQSLIDIILENME